MGIGGACDLCGNPGRVIDVYTRTTLCPECETGKTPTDHKDEKQSSNLKFYCTKCLIIKSPPLSYNFFIGSTPYHPCNDGHNFKLLK